MKTNSRTGNLGNAPLGFVNKKGLPKETLYRSLSMVQPVDIHPEREIWNLDRPKRLLSLTSIFFTPHRDASPAAFSITSQNWGKCFFRLIGFSWGVVNP